MTLLLIEAEIHSAGSALYFYLVLQYVQMITKLMNG